MNPLGEQLYFVQFNDDASFYMLMDTISQIKARMIKGTPAEIMAIRNTVRELAGEKISDAIRNTRATMIEQNRTQAESLSVMMETGDESFDAFRRQVREHDFYYSFSDDGSVYRAGEKQRTAIEAIVKERGGMYQTYWKHYQKLKNK